MRVAVIFDNFGPYHIARLSAAASCMDVLGVEVAATPAATYWDVSHTGQGFERVKLLDDAKDRRNGSLLTKAYVSHVGTWNPDAIALPGWSSTAALAGARWAMQREVPALVMSDSNATDFPRHVMTELVKKQLVTRFQAGFCGGTMARAYLVDLGLPGDRIFLGYDVVDNAHFASGAAMARETGASPEGINPSWRGRFFLSSARFLPKKNLPRLIEAFARYQQGAGPAAWPLVLLGDGPMRGELERRRSALGLDASFLMPGFKQYDELSLYYGNAGAFVLSSTTEQWGLVINEAMASGLPVLVSERCGCAPDLVDNGRNGYTFDPYDTGSLTALMLEMASDRCDRASMGQASREIIAQWTPETFARGLKHAAEAALDSLPRQPSLFDKALLWSLSHR